VYPPGCPPGPETLIHAIETLRDKIDSGELLRRREQTGAGAGVVIEQRDGIVEPAATPAGTAAGARR
jgi:NADH-quinone oxidoreductase subunit B